MQVKKGLLAKKISLSFFAEALLSGADPGDGSGAVTLFCIEGRSSRVFDFVTTHLVGKRRKGIRNPTGALVAKLSLSVILTGLKSALFARCSPRASALSTTMHLRSGKGWTSLSRTWFLPSRTVSAWVQVAGILV